MNNDIYDGFNGYDGENEEILCFEECLDNDDFDIVKVKAITPKSLDANKVWVTDKLFHYFPEQFCSDKNTIGIPQNMDITIRRTNGSKVIDVDSNTLYKLHNQELEVIGVRNAEIKKVNITTMKSVSELKSKYDKIDKQLELYNTVMRQPLIDNFDAVMEKYIAVGAVEEVYDNKIEIEHADKLNTFILDRTYLRVLAWAIVRGKISGKEFMRLDAAMTRSQEVDETVYISFGEAVKEINDLIYHIIDEILERNDWEFLKEREVTGE